MGNREDEARSGVSRRALMKAGVGGAFGCAAAAGAAPGRRQWGRVEGRHCAKLRSLAYWYWFGRLEFLHGGDLSLRWIDHIWELTGGGVRGVRFNWVRRLQPGSTYEFRLLFSKRPDYILLGKEKVWDVASDAGQSVSPGRGDWRREEARYEVSFRYTSQKPTAGPIVLMKDEAYRGRRSSRALCFGLSFKRPCARCVRLGKKQDLSNPTVALPSRLNVTRSPGLLRYFPRKTSEPVKLDLPLDANEVDYPVSPVILDMTADPDSPGWENYRQYIPEYGLNIHHSGLDKARKTMEAVPRKYVLQTYATGHLNIDQKREKWFTTYKKRLNRFMEEYPDYRVRLFPKETISHPTQTMFNLPEYRDIANAWDPTVNVCAKLRTMMRVNRQMKEKLEKQVKKPENLIVHYQGNQGSYPSAYLYGAGADMISRKTIHRQNVQLLVANGRGAARVYSRPWEMEYDAWTAYFFHTHHPDEFEQALYTWFFSGPQVISTWEAPSHERLGRVDNEWGRRWLKFSRFVRRHPHRGPQVVRIGVMRGFGDEWYHQRGFNFRFGRNQWNTEKQKVDRAPLRPIWQDYRLLNVFWPGYRKLSRFCTGTPHGPVDMLPWDSPAGELDRYGLVVLMGVNAVGRPQYENLKEYVASGGTLVLSLGQLRKEAKGVELKKPRPLWRTSFPELLGIEIESSGGQPVPIHGSKKRGKDLFEDQHPISFRLDGRWQKTFARHPYRIKHTDDKNTVLARGGAAGRDGRGEWPVLIRRDYGDGRVYFYATEFMGFVSPEVNARFLSGLARECRQLEFEPPSDELEYTVQRKGRTFIVSILNHGRIPHPSGLPGVKEAWEGRVRLQRDRMGADAESYGAFRIDPDDLSLDPVECRAEGGELAIPLRVDKWAELVVGPPDRVQEDFYEKRTEKSIYSDKWT